jgi:predicted HNH restriction endonuclease
VAAGRRPAGRPGTSAQHPAGRLGSPAQASGVLLTQAAADRLEARWEAHLGALGRITTWLADEIPPSQRFPEGASTKVLVNRYGRDPRARRACLAHWGWDCAVCGFNFARVYGGIGEQFMHVHHLRDLASLGGSYHIDPIQDLRPVCPNCHAMLHQRRSALPIAELQEQLRVHLNWHPAEEVAGEGP